jgi:type IV secretion system protein VirD4
LKQVEAAYGKDQSLIETCGTLLALTPNRNDFQTGKYLSDLMGDATVVERHRSWSGNGTNISEQKSRRALMTPGEVLELATDKALIFKRGAKPFVADHFNYRDDRTFRRWSEIEPPNQSDRIYRGVDYVRVAEPTGEMPELEVSQSALPYWEKDENADREKTTDRTARKA